MRPRRGPVASIQRSITMSPKAGDILVSNIRRCSSRSPARCGREVHCGRLVARCRVMRRILATLALLTAAASLPYAAPALLLPNTADSLKLAVLGDNGTGKQPQMEIAAQMAASHQQFPFELVLMMG